MNPLSPLLARALAPHPNELRQIAKRTLGDDYEPQIGRLTRNLLTKANELGLTPEEAWQAAKRRAIDTEREDMLVLFVAAELDWREASRA